MYEFLSKISFCVVLIGILSMFFGSLALLIGFETMFMVTNGFIIIIYGVAGGVIAILIDLIFG